MGDGGLHRVATRRSVDVEHVPAGLLGEVLGPAKLTMPALADTMVEPARAGDAVVEHGLQRVVVADVDPAGDDAAVEASTSLTVWARSSGVAIG